MSHLLSWLLFCCSLYILSTQALSQVHTTTDSLVLDSDSLSWLCDVAVMITPWWKSIYWIIYCAVAIQLSQTFESCWLYHGRHWLCLLFVISVFQVSHWSIWSIWNRFFCRVIDMKLISLFYMRATNILSRVFWKCCLFSSMYFWHLCSIFFHDWNTTWVTYIKK